MAPSAEQNSRYTRVAIRENFIQLAQSTNTAEPEPRTGNAQLGIFQMRPVPQSQEQNTSVHTMDGVKPYSHRPYFSTLDFSTGAETSAHNLRPYPVSKGQTAQLETNNRLRSYSQSLYDSTLDLMSNSGCHPLHSNSRTFLPNAAGADSQPQTTPSSSLTSGRLLHPFNSRANRVEKITDKIIQDCNKPLERQEQSVEEARKQLGNLRVGWSSRLQPTPRNTMATLDLGAREEEFLMARSKDLEKERKNFVSGLATPTVAPYTNGNKRVRDSNCKVCEKKTSEAKNGQRKEIIGQMGPSGLSDPEVERDFGIRRSYRIFNTPPPGWPNLDSHDHDETQEGHRLGPYSLGPYQRPNSEVKVPQVSNTPGPRFLPSTSSATESDAFPKFPSPSYGYASSHSRGEFESPQSVSTPNQRDTEERKHEYNDLRASSKSYDPQNTTAPLAQTLCGHNKKLERELREPEEKAVPKEKPDEEEDWIMV